MPTTEITTAAANDDVPVPSLQVHRRQRRLERLLDIHARLARMSLEHRAHGLAEQAQELFTQQLAVEDVLASICRPGAGATATPEAA